MRRRRTRSTVIGFLLLLCSLALSTGTVWAYLSGGSINPQLFSRVGSLSPVPSPGAIRATSKPGPAPSPTATPTPAPLPTITDLTLTAQAAVLMDADSGAIIYAHHADEPQPPASTAKIITALTVIRHAGPEEVVTIQPEDLVDPAQESSMGLQAGDTVTVHDLLVGLLLPSGNDAATALARFIGQRLPGDPNVPPSDRFIAEMNVVAADLGMERSHFADPAGNDVAGQLVTARELANAARAALETPPLLQIVAMPTAQVRVGGPQPRSLTLTNTNALLGEAGVYGIKTGTTVDAGQCLVMAYRREGRELIAVILGSQDRYADARKLLERTGQEG